MTKPAPASPAGADLLSGRLLLLLRHAHAAAAASPGDAADHARDLDRRGRHDASALGSQLRQLAIAPDHVLVSSAVRTRRSWELLGLPEPPPGIDLSDRLYLAPAATLLDCLQAAPPQARIVLLVGHNPGLHELVLRLAGQQRDLPGELASRLQTCTLVGFPVSGALEPADWSALSAETVGPPWVLRP